MSLDKAMKMLKFDKRMTEWAVNNGQMTKEELKKHLDSLPDLKDNVELVSIADDHSRGETH